MATRIIRSKKVSLKLSVKITLKKRENKTKCVKNAPKTALKWIFYLRIRSFLSKNVCGVRMKKSFLCQYLVCLFQATENWLLLHRWQISNSSWMLKGCQRSRESPQKSGSHRHPSNFVFFLFPSKNLEPRWPALNWPQTCWASHKKDQRSMNRFK